MRSFAPELRELMTAEKLTQPDVAKLALVNLKTVEGWLADPSAASYRRMNARHLKLIRAMLPGFTTGRSAGRK